MLNVKVLGSGCSRCKWLAETVQNVATKHGLPVEIEKVTDFEEMMKWAISTTPGLVINDRLVSAGRIPSESEILAWLTA